MDSESRLPSIIWMGLIESLEGFHKTKTDLPGARRNSARVLPLDSNCSFSMGLKPAGLPYRYWIYQACTITWGNSLDSINLNLFFSISLPPAFSPYIYLNAFLMTKTTRGGSCFIPSPAPNNDILNIILYYISGFYDLTGNSREMCLKIQTSKF